jgi:hypothetical protein
MLFNRINTKKYTFYMLKRHVSFLYLGYKKFLNKLICWKFLTCLRAFVVKSSNRRNHQKQTILLQRARRLYKKIGDCHKPSSDETRAKSIVYCYFPFVYSIFAGKVVDEQKINTKNITGETHNRKSQGRHNRKYHSKYTRNTIGRNREINTKNTHG